MALPTPPPATNPIPNNPFFSVPAYLANPSYPVIVGAGLSLNPATSVLTSTGGGGAVSSVTAGAGISVTPSIGNVVVSNAGVTSLIAGAGVTLSGSTGAITISASGGGGGVTSVTGTAPIQVATGTTTPVISIDAALPAAIGAIAGYTDITDTDFNTALGYCALGVGAGSASGFANVAVGLCAGCSVTTAYGNTLIGPGTGIAIDTGNTNTALGIGALQLTTSGLANLAVGMCSGCAFTTESGNAVFGGYAGDPGDTNTLVLSDGLGNLKAKFDDLGALSFDGASYGAIGEVLSSNGAGAKPTWIAAGGAPATPTVEGILYGCSGTTTTGVGCNILASLGAGLCNTAVGCSVLSSIVNGGSNTAVGYKAGSSVITTGSFNVAMGSLALGNATGTGNISNNTAIGMRTLSALEAGSCNVAVGSCSMCSQISGGSNVAIGYASLWNSTTGIGNVAIGFGSLLQSSTAGFNIGVGYASMQANTTGTCNIAVGICAHDNLDGGCNNVALGFSAGQNLSTGCYNVSIGDSVCLADPTGSCQLAIGFSPTENWLTGDSTKAIKPGAGIIDCAASTGTAGQVLMSNGSNAICWGGGVSGTYTFGTCTVVITNGLITSVT